MAACDGMGWDETAWRYAKVWYGEGGMGGLHLGEEDGAGEGGMGGLHLREGSQHGVAKIEELEVKSSQVKSSQVTWGKGRSTALPR
jgi:hypothetical protein